MNARGDAGAQATRLRDRQARKAARLLAIAKEAERRPTWDLRAQCIGHPKQLAFIKDPSRAIVGVCTRRAGKTRGNAMILLDTAQRVPDGVSVFLAITRGQAKRIIWHDLKHLVMAHFPEAAIDASDLVITLPNGHRIYVSGAPDVKSIEKWLGLAIDVAIIDEAQKIGAHLDELIYRVLRPALSDRDGALVLTGTPGGPKFGAFWDAWTNDRWSKHRWGFWDNPFYMKGRTKDDRLAEERAFLGLPEDGSDDSVTFRNEWLGEWEVDARLHVFRWTQERNDFKAEVSLTCTDGFNDFVCQGGDLPEDMHTVMGIDTGHNHRDAIAVLGWSPTDPQRRLWLVHESIREGRDRGFGHLFAKVHELWMRYGPVKVVIDPAQGATKAYLDWVNEFRVPIEVAGKADKVEFINRLDSDLVSGRLMVKKQSQAATESHNILWDRPDEMGRRRPRPGFHSDIWDAILYAHRHAFHYLAKERPKDRPKDMLWGNFDPQEDLRREIELSEERQRRKWWQ